MVSVNDYNLEEALKEMDCQKAVEKNLKVLNIRHLNENGESFGFDAVTKTLDGVIWLEYEHLNLWTTSQFPYKRFHIIESKAVRKFIKLTHMPDEHKGLYIFFNKNYKYFAIFEIEEILEQPTEMSKMTRNNTTEPMKYFYYKKEDVPVFKIEDIERVLINFWDKGYLNGLRVRQR